ncbi:hypothetical protein FDK21_16275 [Cohaesibacter sp. CAU 1516]|uniref:hypothetical protein n=1 Tax=Cohaesibacter sp. CAU 1516 TaxID=2576038 RepID=UPI0010FF1875|nr:hypothetical protein [Cohaesibacter sp. CAU 1516]TLP43780.1 hypothetical protein FDK21_16275 [Cohaesibacter sp. CAU 1516]
MFKTPTKSIMIALILSITSAATTATTSVHAGEFRHHRSHGNDMGNAAAIGAAGFLIGSLIGATLHKRDGGEVSSHYPRVGPRNTRVYVERDRHGRVLKRKIIRKKKIRYKTKRRPTFASSYDPRTNIRTTAYRDARGQRVVIRTRGRGLPPQVR